jgi:pimeloyl-ACP methyl ester carboxylesterase
MKSHEKCIDVEGVKTRYLDLGTGEPIVFVHGASTGDFSGAESAEVWDLNYPALSGRYRCVAVDRLGQGKTGNPTSDAGYTMGASVAHVIAFVKTLNLGPVHAVGHSRGAYVVTQVTLTAPELVRSCTIVSSNTVSPGYGRNSIVFAPCPYPPYSAERARYTLENYSYRSDHIDSDWFRQRQEILESKKYREACQRMQDGGLYESQYLAQLEIDREAMFACLERQSIGRPTMLVWGMNDPTARLEQGYDLYDLIARHQLRCQLHILNQAGHYCFRERPEEFNRVLTNFIEDVRYGV